MRVAVTLVPPDLRLRTPATSPLGRPLKIVLRSAVLAGHATGTAQLSVTGASGFQTTRGLKHVGGQEFSPSREIAVPDPGVYSAQAAIRSEGRLIARTAPVSVRVTATPYVAVPDKSVSSREPAGRAVRSAARRLQGRRGPHVRGRPSWRRVGAGLGRWRGAAARRRSSGAAARGSICGPRCGPRTATQSTCTSPLAARRAAGDRSSTCWMRRWSPSRPSAT